MGLTGVVGDVARIYGWPALVVGLLVWVVDYGIMHLLVRLQLGYWSRSQWMTIRVGDLFFLPALAVFEVLCLRSIDVEALHGKFYVSWWWMVILLGVGWSVSIARTVEHIRHKGYSAQLTAWWNIYHEIIWGPLFCLFTFGLIPSLRDTHGPGWPPFFACIALAAFVFTFYHDAWINKDHLPIEGRVF